jgi:hypothetical protein
VTDGSYDCRCSGSALQCTETAQDAGDAARDSGPPEGDEDAARNGNADVTSDSDACNADSSSCATPLRCVCSNCDSLEHDALVANSCASPGIAFVESVTYDTGVTEVHYFTTTGSFSYVFDVATGKVVGFSYSTDTSKSCSGTFPPGAVVTSCELHCVHFNTPWDRPRCPAPDAD